MVTTGPPELLPCSFHTQTAKRDPASCLPHAAPWSLPRACPRDEYLMLVVASIVSFCLFGVELSLLSRVLRRCCPRCCRLSRSILLRKRPGPDSHHSPDLNHCRKTAAFRVHCRAPPPLPRMVLAHCPRTRDLQTERFPPVSLPRWLAARPDALHLFHVSVGTLWRSTHCGTATTARADGHFPSRGLPARMRTYMHACARAHAGCASRSCACIMHACPGGIRTLSPRRLPRLSGHPLGHCCAGNIHFAVNWLVLKSSDIFA
jgi:hypothetical protein